MIERGLDGRAAREPVSPFMLAFEILIFESMVVLCGSRRDLGGNYG